VSDVYRVANETRGTVLAERSGRVHNPVSRGLGLMGKKGLPPDGGLIIEPCSGVVSFFMRFPIDVVFLDADRRVVHLVEHLRPWKASKIVRASRLVVELPTGTIGQTGTKLGDTISIAPVS
jgi:uncharacterized membrane protein (UPF0127 family)